MGAAMIEWGGRRWKRMGWNDEVRGPILVTSRLGTFAVFPKPIEGTPTALDRKDSDG